MNFNTNKKILMISTSPRMGSNSQILSEAFMNGATESGHTVEMIDLHDKAISFCKGCLACQKNKRCIIHDDAEVITQKMLTADVIVFATPIYFYEMSGQMKTLLDRTNPLYPSDYTFKDIYLIASAAEDEASAIDGAVHGLEEWISCFERATLKGVIRGIGLEGVSAVKESKAILSAAYDMGKNV